MSTNNIVAPDANLIKSRPTKAECFETLYFQGYSLVPLSTETKTALVEWKQFQSRQPTKEEIKGWVNQFKGQGFNWGLLTGKAPKPAFGAEFATSLVLLDADDREAQKLVDDYCPKTAAVQITGKDKASGIGKHFVFRRPSAVDYPYIPIRRGTIINGTEYKLDVRADGGLIVAPGSNHHSGGVYHWLEEWTPELLASLPVYDPLAIPHCKTSTTVSMSGARLTDSVGSASDPAPSISLPMEARKDQLIDWLAACPGAQQGRGASQYVIALAITGIHGFAVDEATALDAFYSWGQREDQTDENGAYYPWTFAEIKHKVSDAAKITYTGKIGDRLNVMQWIHSVDVDALIEPFPSSEATTTVTPLAATYVFSEADHPSFDDAPFIPKAEVPKAVRNPALRQTSSGRQINWLSAGDINKRAIEQPITWFVDGWIMQGGLHMLAGSSFAGKSQLLADWATAIANGLPFGGMEIVQTPVLMIDCENHCSITNSRIKGKIDVDSKFMMWLDDNIISEWLPLTVETLEELILDYYAATGHDHCVVFADTLRSIFQIDELDPKQINELFYPLQRLARRLNMAIVLLNHRPKSGATYSGHNAMMAALDMFMVYEREADSTASTLKMTGTRLKKPDDIRFYFDASTCSLTQMPVASSAAVKVEDKLATEFIDKFPTQASEALTRDEAYLLFPELSEKTVRNRLEEAQRPKHPRLECVGGGKNGKPFRYFRV